MPDVRIDVYTETHGSPEKLNRTEEALGGVEQRGEGLNIGLKKLGTQFAGMVVGAFAFSKAVSFLSNELKASVKAAMEQEKADRSLAASLEITGRSIPLERMKQFASSLQRQTIYGDEAIQGVQALLVQMTQLDEEGLQKATKGAVGLASVLGVDLQSAAQLVAKAMEGNYAALSRYGIKVDENLTAGEKQAQLMEKLSSFYQRAQADAETFAGRITQLQAVFGDFREKVGDAVIKSRNLNEVLSLLKLTMDQFGEATSQSLGPLGLLASVVDVIGAELKEKFALPLAYLALEQAKANKTARELNDAYDRGDEHWERMGWVSRRLAEGVDFLNEEQTKLLATQNALFGSDVRKKIDEAQRALELYIKTGDATPAGIAAMEDYIAKLSASLQTTKLNVREITADIRMLRTFGVDIQAAIVETSGSLGRMVGDSLGKIIDTKDDIRDVADGLDYAAQRAREFEAASLSAVSTTRSGWENAAQAISMLDGAFSQFETNRTIAIDNEYKRRLATINRTITDEKSRQNAIMALEAEYQIKRREAARTWAVASKAAAMAQAIINVHEAYTKALAQGGLFGIPMAAIIAALGAIQIAAIAAQPIPLARGGVFTRRTKLTSEGGRVYEVAENEPEVVSPKSVIRQAVEEAGGGSGRVAMTLNIQGPLAVFQGATEDQVRRLGPLLVKAVEDELHTFGARLVYG